MAAIALVACPYDSVHRVKQSRLQLHISKCRQNHLNEAKFICPFNATHVLPLQERNFHLLNCEYKHPLDRKLIQDSDDINQGRLAVPSYSEAPLPPTDESWDDEITNGPAFVPRRVAPIGAIVEPPQEYKPAMKRQFYKDLHTRPLSEDDYRPGNRSQEAQIAPKKETPLRVPAQPSMVEMENRQFQNRPVSGLGLGRGRGNGAPRIAANIFPAPVQPGRINGPPGFPPLGMGRGSAPAAIFADDDFPALGLGRGVSRK